MGDHKEGVQQVSTANSLTKSRLNREARAVYVEDCKCITAMCGLELITRVGDSCFTMQEHAAVAHSAELSCARLTLALLQSIQVCDQGLNSAIGLFASSFLPTLELAGLLNCRVSFPHRLQTCSSLSAWCLPVSSARLTLNMTCERCILRTGDHALVAIAHYCRQGERWSGFVLHQ